MMPEAIDRIQNLAKAAAGAQIVRPPAEPDSVYYVVCNGTVQRMRANAPDRNHKVKDIESLVACAVRLSGEDSPASIWCARTGVVVMCDDFDRRDQIRLELALSPQLTLLQSFSAGPNWLDQQSLIRTLRSTFRLSTAGTDTVALFRRLRFRSTATGDKVIEHGKASIGRSLEAEVNGTDRLPEEIHLQEPVFNGGALGIYFSITCAVEIDLQTERIALIPPAGAIEAALLQAEQELAGRVRDELHGYEESKAIRCYIGSP